MHLMCSKCVITLDIFSVLEQGSYDQTLYSSASNQTGENAKEKKLKNISTLFSEFTR